jgi:hypothetical protein
LMLLLNGGVVVEILLLQMLKDEPDLLDPAIEV